MICNFLEIVLSLNQIRFNKNDFGRRHTNSDDFIRINLTKDHAIINDCNSIRRYTKTLN